MLHWLRLMIIWCLALAAVVAAFLWLFPWKHPDAYDSRSIQILFRPRCEQILADFDDAHLTLGDCEYVYDEGVIWWFIGASRFKDTTRQFYVSHTRPIASFSRPRTHLEFGGFAFTFGDRPGAGPVGPSRVFAIALPCWFVVLLLSTHPLISFLGGPFRRWHRRRHGRCVKCAYNLAGLTEPRCPECGTPVANKSEANSISELT